MPKLLFVTHKPFFPDSSGGAQRSTLSIFQTLQKNGWEVEVVCRLPVTIHSLRVYGFFPLLKSIFSIHHALDDRSMDFICRRKSTRAVLSHLGRQNFPKDFLHYFDHHLQRYHPDIVLGDTPANSPMIEKAIERGFRTLHLARSIPFLKVPSILNPRLQLIGNSPYTANVLKAVSCRDAEVILPGIDPQSYQVEAHERKYITLINPVPQKGVELATRIASLMPEESFLFVKGRWSGLRNTYMEELLAQARELANVEIWENQEDIRTVYRVTKLLLVPSQFIETFGRVVIEAHINGIPVVSSNSGGLPFTVGKGGTIIEPGDDLDSYIKTIRNYCQNNNFYEQQAACAIENSKRIEFTAEHQEKNLLRIMNTMLCIPNE